MLIISTLTREKKQQLIDYLLEKVPHASNRELAQHIGCKPDTIANRRDGSVGLRVGTNGSQYKKRKKAEYEVIPNSKYVYVISHPKYKGWYKIGVAINPKNRLRQYQIGDPYREYKLEFCKSKKKFEECEKYIITKFESKCEWVKDDLQEIIKAIRDYEN